MEGTFAAERAEQKARLEAIDAVTPVNMDSAAFGSVFGLEAAGHDVAVVPDNHTSITNWPTLDTDNAPPKPPNHDTCCVADCGRDIPPDSQYAKCQTCPDFFMCLDCFDTGAIHIPGDHRIVVVAPLDSRPFRRWLSERKAHRPAGGAPSQPTHRSPFAVAPPVRSGSLVGHDVPRTGVYPPDNKVSGSVVSVAPPQAPTGLAQAPHPAAPLHPAAHDLAADGHIPSGLEWSGSGPVLAPPDAHSRQWAPPGALQHHPGQRYGADLHRVPLALLAAPSWGAAASAAPAKQPAVAAPPPPSGEYVRSDAVCGEHGTLFCLCEHPDYHLDLNFKRAYDAARTLLKRQDISEDDFQTMCMDLLAKSDSGRLQRVFQTAIATAIDSFDCLGGFTTSDLVKALRAMKYVYDPVANAWQKQGLLVIFKPGGHFGQGRMRQAFHFKDLTRPAHEHDWVAKVPMAEADRTVRAYTADVQMQSLCQYLARLFNRRNPPKPVHFLEAGVMELLDPPPDKAFPRIFHVEQFLIGRYVKHNSNWGFVSAASRSTPQSFSHYTYELTAGALLVCDMQGVDDFYTDPQIHTSDGKGFGRGNMGQRGIDRFFETHKCNSICRALQLPSREPVGVPPSEGPGDWGTVLNRTSAAEQYDVGRYDLTHLGLTREQFDELAAAFRRVDVTKSGCILKREVVLLCRELRVELAAEDIVDLAESLASFGTGDISFLSAPPFPPHSVCFFAMCR